MEINGETAESGFINSNAHSRSGVRPGLNEARVADPLAGFICHDLRHPLTAILAYSELLAESDLDGLQRTDLHQEIRRAVGRMNDLIALLMESYKGAALPRSEFADIVETVSRAIQVVGVRPEFRRIVIKYSHEGRAKGRFDPGRLQRVIINVVLNACEAVSPGNGRIDVRSLGHEDFVDISIWDNGPGIPPSIRQALFQPFATYGKQGGTGLGLAIVQRILNDQGGGIRLETTGAGGTQFRLVLPFAAPAHFRAASRNAGRDQNPALQ